MTRFAKPIVFALCLLPLAWLAHKGWTAGFGAHPQEYVNRFLGDWALRFLLLALAVTPLRQIGDWPQLARFRRMIGLYAFFYVVLHVSSYVVATHFFDWAAIWKDIVKRNYITVGMAVFVMLLPLAATSTAAMVKRLGAARWKKLHRLVYLAGIGGVFHFFMMVKLDWREPLLYAVLLAFLLGYRAFKRLRRA
ncbi:MAG: sulfoxide reductase heme-binding subunit YedZ [Rhodospirillales bacterium]|nr:sulfoxide reductase heme-binding subunit YedZ [Rhodospirillales bacterium]MSP79658.1 sulfoxide reductase heme-binding subunit YedZ [Rhodospirillales bacterium]